jgi:hypothetical protein
MQVTLRSKVLHGVEECLACVVVGEVGSEACKKWCLALCTRYKKGRQVRLRTHACRMRCRTCGSHGANNLTPAALAAMINS